MNWAVLRLPHGVAALHLVAPLIESTCGKVPADRRLGGLTESLRQRFLRFESSIHIRVALRRLLSAIVAALSR